MFLNVKEIFIENSNEIIHTPLHNLEHIRNLKIKLGIFKDGSTRPERVRNKNQGSVN